MLPDTLCGFMGDYVARYRVTRREAMGISVGVKFNVYFSCFFGGYPVASSALCLPRYLQRRCSNAQLLCARFRCGSHRLRVELLRWSREHIVPRAQRHCRLCGSGVEDECHVFFYCPRLQFLRDRFPAMFALVSDVRDGVDAYGCLRRLFLGVSIVDLFEFLQTALDYVDRIPGNL
jgi:hypothetical protein